VLPRILVIATLASSACRPTNEPAPLAPTGDDAGSSASAPAPVEPAPEPTGAPADGVAPAPSGAEVCEAYANGYCEPGDPGPEAVKPEFRKFVVLECQKKLLEHPEAATTVMHCVESTKDCGAMQKCLP
jgi:hypothetical protein